MLDGEDRWGIKWYPEKGKGVQWIREWNKLELSLFSWLYSLPLHPIRLNMDIPWLKSWNNVTLIYALLQSSHSTCLLIHRTILRHIQSRLLFSFVSEKSKIQRVKSFYKGHTPSQWQSSGVLSTDTMFLLLHDAASAVCSSNMASVREGKLNLFLLVLSVSRPLFFSPSLLIFKTELRWETWEKVYTLNEAHLYP